MTDIRIKDTPSNIADILLGRDPVEPDAKLIQENIKDKAVMVTGAGGSIGSEICRQVASQGPKVLILYELNEFALYTIHVELMRTHPDVKVIPALGSILNCSRVSYFLSKFNINTIYHAAAYKHVPMVEYNITEGVYNNFIGTAALVTTADGNVDTFVLVSTDKAVRPTNVMGATKRLSEMYVQAVQERPHRTKTTFSMVRFGNVLGSSGSVIPLFLEQIARGEPLTITHPEITRYFMSIPEAAQLVIQAGAMATGGEVFVLDMGQSVKIVDMAKRLLQHYNLPENHYEITGLRPGEKLYEELLIGDSVEDTYHPRIMKANEFHPSYSRMLDIYDIIEICYNSMDFEGLFTILKEEVSGFNHSGDIKDHLYEHY